MVAPACRLNERSAPHARRRAVLSSRQPVVAAALLALLVCSAPATAQQPPGGATSAPDAVAGVPARTCPASFNEALGPRDFPVGAGRCIAADTTPPRKREKAIELSDAYETRLAIHKWASYATIPLFTAQAIVGQRLFTIEQAGNRAPNGLRDTHDLLAVGVGALFAVNTVTGAMNWWETRSQPDGRTWRTIHGALMLASDGGFAYTALLGTNARRVEASRVLHKNWAIGSASVALVSYLMMLSPFRRGSR
jgi:hypothetical protein